MAQLKSRSLFVRDATGFVKGFGALDVVLIATSMIWALTYMVTQYPWFYGFNPGSDLSLALPIAAIPFAFLLLVYWGIGVIMPRSGSDYVWVSRIISPSIGFAWSLFYMFVVFTTSYISICFPFTYLISSGFTIWGMLYNSPSLGSIGIYLSSASGSFFFSVFLTVVFAVFAILGSRFIKALLYTSWAVALAGVVVTWWMLASASPGIFAAKWNAVMSGYPTYEALMGAAKTAGWTPTPLAFSAVLASLPLAALFMFGGNYGGNVILGEVKGIKKAVPIALFLSLVLGVLFWAVGGYLELHAVGGDWLRALAYTWEVQPSAYTLPFPPSLPLFLSVLAYPNSLLIGIVFFTWIVGSIQALFVYFWVPSRYFFAWAFDRILPLKFASVSDRFHSPNYSIAAIVVLSVVLLGLTAYGGWSNAFALGTFLWVISYVVPALAAVILPYKKKELLAHAPGFMSRKVAGVPVLSIIGVIAAVSYGYMGYVAYTNPLITSLTVTGLLIGVGVIVVGFVVYFASAAYQKSKGIDLSLTFKELPPE